MEKEELLAHINARNAPINNPHNTSPNTQGIIMSMANGKWSEERREVGIAPTRSRLVNNQKTITDWTN